MVTATKDPVFEIWDQVRNWPPQLRLSLASRLIQSLERESTPPIGRRPVPADLIGAWKMDNPPTDEEVERILEEEHEEVRLMRVLLDTNVVLDSLLQRQPWHADADAILSMGQSSTLELAVSSHSLANVFYVGRRAVGVTRARNDIRRSLQMFDVLPVDHQTLLDADALPGVDFEDNIQIATAVRANVDAIVTRDPAGFVSCPISVLSPADLLKRLTP